MEIKGRIIQIMPLVTGVSAKGEWKKQDYILQTDDQYPKKICFNAWGSKVDDFALNEGDEVVVSIDIESREFNGRWYTDVRAWKVDRSQPMQQQQQFAGAPAYSGTPFPPQEPYFPPANGGNNSTDDLPF